MRKMLLSVLAVIFCFSLVACAGDAVTDTPPPSALPSSSAVVSPTPSFSPSPSITPSASVLPSVYSSPSPTVLIPDTNIPDVILSPADFVVHSGFGMYEDESYVCYFFKGVRVIDKHTGKNMLVSDYGSYTLYNEKVYYADDGWIQCYDIATGKNVGLLAVGNEVLSLLGYEGRLYYSYCVNYDFENAYDIYSITLNGKDLKPLGPNGVDNFCFAYGKLYYDTPEDSPLVYEYDLETDVATKLCKSDYFFQLFNGRLYYSDSESNLIQVVDLESGETRTIADRSSEFALLGQYVIYVTHESKVGMLYAYDVGSGKTYKLLTFEETEYPELYSTPYGAYISVYRDGFTEPCRIVISGGEASLEEISNI